MQFVFCGNRFHKRNVGHRFVLSYAYDNTIFYGCLGIIGQIVGAGNKLPIVAVVGFYGKLYAVIATIWHILFNLFLYPIANVIACSIKVSVYLYGVEHLVFLL